MCIRDRVHLLIAAGATILLNLWAIIPILDLIRYPLQVNGDTRALTGYALYALSLIHIFSAPVTATVGNTFSSGSSHAVRASSVSMYILL